MAALDEGVGNLERLCALLAQTNGSLKDQTTRAEEGAEAVQALEDRSERELDGLGDELQDLQETVKDDTNGSVDAVEALGSSARAAADERLPAVEQDLGEAQASARQRLGEDESRLESGFSELASAGFEVFDSSVEAVEGGVQASGEASAEAFGDFEGAVGGLAQQVEAFAGDTAAALEGGADAMAGDVAASVEQTGSECEAAWTDELPAALASQCSAVAGSLAGAYGGFGEEGMSEGEALLERVSGLGSGTAGFLLNEQGTQVEEAGTAAAEQAFPELLGELGSVQATLQAGVETAGALEPMVGELQISENVVAQVAELLAAIGG